MLQLLINHTKHKGRFGRDATSPMPDTLFEVTIITNGMQHTIPNPWRCVRPAPAITLLYPRPKVISNKGVTYFQLRFHQCQLFIYLM